MVKRILPVLVLCAALAVPATAFGDDTTPPPAPTQTTQTQTRACANGQSAAPRKCGRAARLRGLKQRIRRAIKHCRSLSGDEREQCVQKLIDKLEQLKARVDELEAKVKDHCASASATDKRCARADQFIARLEKLKAQIDKVEQKLRDHLSGGSSSSSSATDSSDVSSVADLEAALQAVENQGG